MISVPSFVLTFALLTVLVSPVAADWMDVLIDQSGDAVGRRR